MPAVTGTRTTGIGLPWAYLGVDPGASGGMALVAADGQLILAEPTQPTEADIWGRYFNLTGSYRVFCIIEQVSGYIGEAQPGSTMFKFGMSYGGLRMALTAACIPFEMATPQAWQKGMSISPRNNKGGETKTSFKNRLKAKAQQLFPGRAITLATADAIIIAEYARRLRGVSPQE